MVLMPGQCLLPTQQHWPVIRRELRVQRGVVAVPPKVAAEMQAFILNTKPLHLWRTKWYRGMNITGLRDSVVVVVIPARP